MFIDVKGVLIPGLGFGTYKLHGGAGTRLLCYAIELGYRHIDAAEEYGTEPEVGRAIRASGVAREDIFLVTKVRRENLARDAVRRSVEQSLRKLRTEYVDLLLIHWPSDVVPLGETLEAFEQLKAEGKTRHIGVSNFTVPLLEQAIHGYGAELLTNQVEYHVFLAQDVVLEYLRARGIMLTAHSPLAAGLPPMSPGVARAGRGAGRKLARVGGRHVRSVLRVVQHALLRSSRVNPLVRPAAPDHPLLARIGAEYGKSAAQVALRWLVEQDGVSAIPRAENEQECRENLDIFDFALSAEDRAAIAGLAAGCRVCDPTHAPAWDAPAAPRRVA